MKQSVINYIFLFLSINYTIISWGIIHTDNTGYLLILFSVLSLIASRAEIVRNVSKLPFFFWFVWCLYALFNYYLTLRIINPIDNLDLYKRIFMPLIAMNAAYVEYMKDPIRLIKNLFIFFATFIFLSVVFDPTIFTIKLDAEREDSILENSFANHSVLTLLPLILLKQKKMIRPVLFYLFLAAILLLLAFSGTRKGFGAAFIFIGFYVLSIMKMSSFKSLFLACVVGLVVYLGYNWILENTFMGQRIEFLSEQQQNQLPENAPQFLNIFGDRARHYYYGFKNFMDNPLFGVGLGQSRVGYGYLHTEYIAQLSDNGIVGFMLFFFLYLWIFVHLVRKIAKERKIAFTFLSAFLAICFMNLFLWSWDSVVFFIILGVLTGYSKSKITLSSINIKK